MAGIYDEVDRIEQRICELAELDEFHERFDLAMSLCDDLRLLKENLEMEEHLSFDRGYWAKVDEDAAERREKLTEKQQSLKKKLKN